MTEQQLIQLKKKIEDSKQRVSELQGQQKAQLQQLNDEWGCKTTEEAEAKIKTLQKEQQTLTKQIQEGLEEIEEKYQQ